MKKFGLAVAVAVPILILVGLVCADEKPKTEDQKPGVGVTALPPHPLDKVFEKDTEKAINEGLLNNELYKKAVTEAMKAKLEQGKKFKDNPKFVGPSPAQAARTKFLEVLRNDKQ